MQTIVSLAPDAELAWLQLAIDNVETARPLDALRALDRIAGRASSGEGWPAYWATRIEANHLLGRHEAELAAARSALRIYPELAVLSGYELRALAALGRVREIERRIETTSARTPDPLSTMRQVAEELRAHGYAREADILLRRVRTQYSASRVAPDSAVAFRSGRARTLYLLDHRSSAAAEYESLLREHPRCTTCMGALGVIAARSGDRQKAAQYEAMLAEDTRPFMFGRPLLLRARIAASLGEVARATTLMNAAFAAGSEYDVMTHTDWDLRVISPDSIYEAFAQVD
jgi:tetratricopeptide (TPR) repeat protein